MTKRKATFRSVASIRADVRKSRPPAVNAETADVRIRIDPPSDDTAGNDTDLSLTASSQVDTERNVRKGTLMNDIWGMKRGTMMEVELNKNGCPIGENGGRYTRFIGTVSRRSYLCPISYLKWSHIPKVELDSIWANEFEPRFHFFPEDYASNIKSWTFENAETKWRQWKHNLKRKHFDFSKSEDANLEVLKAKETDRVDPEQYRIMLRHWQSEAGKKESERNSLNVACNKEPHCAGSKSFSQVAEELAKENNGVRPSRGAIYLHTRKDKNGKYVNTTVEEVGKKLEKVILDKKANQEARQIEREENPELVDVFDIETSGDESDWENDDYSQVKGKPKRGRINCAGQLHISARKRGSGSQVERGDNRALLEKIEQQAAKMKEMELQHATSMEEMKNEQAERIEQIEKRRSDDMNETRKMIQALMDRS